MPRSIPTLALLLALTAGQQVFRSGTELVEVDAVVLDRSGQLVRGLTAADFELYDEGDLQDISTFSFVEAPPTATGVPPEVGLASTATHRAAAVYLIVIDYLHTPSQMAARVRERAREFVRDHMGPADLAAVIHLGLSSGGVEFSSSKPALLAAIDRVRGSGGSPGENPTPDLIPTAIPGRPSDAEVFNLNRLGPIESRQMTDRAVKAYEMLALASQYVAGFTGRRKSMLLFSSGVPINLTELSDAASHFAQAHRKLVALARQSNVSVYTIDVQGLDSGANRAGSHADVALAPPATLNIAWNASAESLRILAGETGGRAFVNHNDLGAPFAQIARDNGSYYLLGFRPRQPSDPKKFRSLKVRVKREGVQVFARQGYGGDSRAGNPATAASLARAWAGETVADLLARPLPGASSGLPLRAAATVIERTSGTATVLLILELEAGALPAEATRLDVGYRAIGTEGDVVASRVDATRLQVSERTRAAIDRHGWRYLTTFDLEPGSYQLRVAAREAQTGGTGIVFIDIDVPALSGERLVVDSVVIGSSGSGATPTAAPRPDLLKAWQVVPTTRRTFSRSETLTAFVQLAAAKPQRATVGIDITSEDGRKMLSASRDVGADVFEPGSPPLAISLALAAFDPGVYVITVSAGPDGTAEATSRRLAFTVIPGS